MGDLPGRGIEPMTPALADRFLTSRPPGKSQPALFRNKSQISHHCLWKYFICVTKIEGVFKKHNPGIIVPLESYISLSIIKYSRHLDEGKIKICNSLQFHNEGYYSIYRHLKNGLDSDSTDGGRGHCRWKKRQGIDSRREGEQIIWWKHKKSCLTEIWDIWRSDLTIFKRQIGIQL